MAFKQTLSELVSDDMKLNIKKALAIGRNQRMLGRMRQILPYQQGKYPIGVNLIGDITAETGLGQSMRILASVMAKGNIPFAIRQVDTHGQLEHNESAWGERMADSLPYAVNLIHFIPATWAADYCRLDRQILDGRYNIAYWLWELEIFPKYWKPCIETVDEIWTPSEFISNCIRKETGKTVLTVPYAMYAETAGIQIGEGIYGRAHFGLPEHKFLFLMMYDFISTNERKNPKAVIEAYQKAFPREEEKVGLIIKVNHADAKKLQQIADELKNYRNVYFFQENLTRQEVGALLNAADVLVSLHRSEGFGLGVAEAMALGKPVITTDWSATTEFTSGECACPVKYRMTRLEKSVGPYEKGNCWADADTDHAAAYMKRLVEDKEYYERIGKNAKKRIEHQLSFGNAAEIMKDRLKKIYEKDSTG